MAPNFDIINDYVKNGILRPDQAQTISQEAQLRRLDPERVLFASSFYYFKHNAPRRELMELSEPEPLNYWNNEAKQAQVIAPVEFLKRDLGRLQEDDNFAPMFVQALIRDATKERASDIHLNPEQFFVRVRYRIDGVLEERFVFHQGFWSRILARLKIIANLDIAESRHPQSGRFEEIVEDRSIDVRLSTLPTVDGENVVIRLLDRLNALIPLADLGYTDKQRQMLEAMVKQPEGLIVVTGPTGSGKTTTLYALLQHLADESRNIMTLEDPVEYRLPLIRQSEVRESGGFSFPAGIRAILRQDPDVILISEIRDEATASAALRAALTGHLVLATVHANNAFGVVHRLLDLGLPANFLASCLRGIISQRLLRKRRDEGYSGRLAVAEIIQMSERLQMQIAHGASLAELRQTAREEGFVSLAEIAQDFVKQGITDANEVKRVLPLFEEEVT